MFFSVCLIFALLCLNAAKKKKKKEGKKLEAKCYISQFFHALIFTTKPDMF